jgi:hypothetical protein
MEQLYKAGDAVTLVNSYGAVFTGKTIVSRDTDKLWEGREPRYFITPTDTPWFSFPQSELRPA